MLGKEVLGDTRADTKRRQAAVNAKKVLEQVTKPSGGRKTGLKRLGTMSQTARVSVIAVSEYSIDVSIVFFSGRKSIHQTNGWHEENYRTKTYWWSSKKIHEIIFDL